MSKEREFEFEGGESGSTIFLLSSIDFVFLTPTMRCPKHRLRFATT